jgi:hypothetical protein
LTVALGVRPDNVEPRGTDHILKFMISSYLRILIFIAVLFLLINVFLNKPHRVAEKKENYYFILDPNEIYSCYFGNYTNNNRLVLCYSNITADAMYLKILNKEAIDKIQPNAVLIFKPLRIRQDGVIEVKLLKILPSP